MLDLVTGLVARSLVVAEDRGLATRYRLLETIRQYAEERLAAFLLNLSQRMKARGYSASEFHLRMSRAEIGSYLGMKVETVSRTFSAFVHQRMLDVDKRHVRITDLVALQHAFDKRVQ